MAVSRPKHKNGTTVLLDAFHVLDVRANLQHFFDISLIYFVNLALNCTRQLPVVILPRIPFTRVTPRDSSIHTLSKELHIRLYHF
ncbi:hypothetical protein SAMD00023353_3200970 [Rosellinia necatrix]|uniref:Uncharacterized protein n=1 Tax=Rosellinia necatrix TaxID=77044 RepID=A0A1S8A8S0_ROSNE|nr:hypothetical protein SAMD00023353_3200970 [Rosellinia necatrix]